MFKLARFLSRALPFLVVVAMMPPPVPAGAWAAPPPLGDEKLSGTVVVTGCTPLGGTFTFTANGTATGNYDGTFFETGSITIDPAGNVTGFKVDPFTITATTGLQAGDTVNGKKMWAAPPGHANCAAEFFALLVNSTYSAVITLPSFETFNDAGTAVTNMGAGGPGSFAECFNPTATTVCS